MSANARAIDAAWTDDAQYFEDPSKLLTSGAAEIRAIAIQFERPPFCR
jgi:hypothetical protein